jgi:site-specific recombinase XerD
LLDPKLKEIILVNGLLDNPGDYFVFTYHGKPWATQSADDFLQKKFRMIRAELNLSKDYTLYSFKHTRAVHLLMDGAQPIDIMQLFRHTDLSTTTKYIRDLGFDLNAKFTDKSRNI